MRDLAMQRGIMWQLWMWIYRIRRVCCPRCIELLLKSRTTVWRQSGLHGQGSQKSVPFYPIVFINLSIRFQDRDCKRSQRLSIDDASVCNSLLELEEYNRFQKVCMVGLDIKQNGWNMKTSRELQVRQSGLFGNCLCMQSKGLLLFLQYRC